MPLLVAGAAAQSEDAAEDKSAQAAETAEQAKLPWKKAGIDVGGYLFTFESEARLDTRSGGDTASIDLEDLLGLDDNVGSFRIGGYWRPWQRHRFEVDYYRMDRDGDQTATVDFDFGDMTIGAGAQLLSEFKIDTYKLSYNYSFVNNQKWDFFGGIGLHAMDIRFKVTASGNVTINDPDGVVIETGGGVSETVATLAPLPVLGLGASYAITPKLFLRGQAQVFGIEIDDYGGHLFDGILGIDYELSKHFGIGAAFNVVDIGIEANASDFKGALDYRYGGLMLYARLFM